MKVMLWKLQYWHCDKKVLDFSMLYWLRTYFHSYSRFQQLWLSC